MKITKRELNNSISVKTKPDAVIKPHKWWESSSKKELGEQFMSTFSFLKEQNQSLQRQASIHARMYGNAPLGGIGFGSTIKPSTNAMPADRPTFSVVTSCVDTLVSRITQSKPRPVFLTDDGDYKQRKLAKQMNSFISGELYLAKVFDKAALILRDACVLGTGVLKLYEHDSKCAVERVICTELLVDASESIYGEPRTLYQMKLVDRDVLSSLFPSFRSIVEKAEQAYTELKESHKSIGDQVMVVEGWRLPSSKDASDGRHTIACSAGVLFDEEYKKDSFPFVFLQYAPRMTGFFGQGIPERQMGTQIEINKILSTISTSMNLVGVPRVFIEKGSKIVKAHLNNNVGSIVEYSGIKPSYEVAPCVPSELYDQLQRLINYSYQSEGISQLAANSQKPGGLTAAAALREYDDLQTDRFAALVKRYENLFIDLSYKIIDKAVEIVERDGSYSTVYPDKNGVKQINLPQASKLNDPYVIKCYDSSSLPKEPSGRIQKVIEWMQAGVISLQEGRRLMEFPDIEQYDKLQNASEERIYKYLDLIIDENEYNPPDPFLDLNLALQISIQYYNLYSCYKLEEEKLNNLRLFIDQTKTLIKAAMPPEQPQVQMGEGTGVPTAKPQAELAQQ